MRKVKTQDGPGRPRIGVEGPTLPYNLRLDPKRHAWLTAQPNGSEWVRQQIDKAMAADQAAGA